MPLAGGALMPNEQLYVSITVVTTPDLIVEINDPQPDRRPDILKMTFREFVCRKLNDDKRIAGIPFFHGHLNADPKDPKYCGAPDSLKKFSTFGDIPMEHLIAHPELYLLRIRGVSRKAVEALKNILMDHRLSLAK
jgi:hypothetical protein